MRLFSEGRELELEETGKTAEAGRRSQYLVELAWGQGGKKE